MAATIAAGPAEHQGAPGHWRLVVILMAIYTYAFIDRAILALLVDPIKLDLEADDVEMSLMLGLAFAAFYGIFSIPAGYFVDRVDRRRLIAIASIAWAAMTIVCGTSQTIAQLYLGRIGVGIAEAVIAPAAFSLIRDAVPTRSRGLAFSIFAMSPMIGGATSLIGGAALLRAAKAGTFVGLPLLGGLEPWQCTLVVIGLCGMPFSLLLFFLREPVRASQVTAETGHEDGMVAGVVITSRYMLGRAAVYLPLLMFAAFGAMISFSNGAWLPAAFGRQWHLTPQQLGPTLGLLTIVGGVAGLFFAGAMMTQITRRSGDIRHYGAVAAVLAAIGIGGSIAVSTLGWAYACAGLGMFFVGSSYAVGATSLAETTPIAMMGKVSAIYLLIQNMIGQALGPLIVALMSTHLFSGRTALPDALIVSLAIFAVATASSAIALGRAIRKSGISAG